MNEKHTLNRWRRLLCWRIGNIPNVIYTSVVHLPLLLWGGWSWCCWRHLTLLPLLGTLLMASAPLRALPLEVSWLATGETAFLVVTLPLALLALTLLALLASPVVPLALTALRNLLVLIRACLPLPEPLSSRSEPTRLKLLSLIPLLNDNLLLCATCLTTSNRLTLLARLTCLLVPLSMETMILAMYKCGINDICISH
jgi:hypothetical protein